MKKRIAVLCAICAVISIFGNMSVVKAKGNSALDQYLEIQAKDHATSVDSKTEEMLNERGFFDNEIESLDKKFIKTIEDGSELTVEVSYYLYTQNGEGQSVQRLEGDDLDDVVKSIYKKQLNLEDADSMSGKYVLKKTVAYAKIRDDYYHISYTADWLTKPKNVKEDTISLKLFNISIDEDAYVNYSYTKKIHTIFGEKDTYQRESKDLTNSIIAKPDSVRVPVKLKGTTWNKTKILTFSKHCITMSGKFDVNNAKIKESKISPEYEHRESKWNVGSIYPFRLTFGEISVFMNGGDWIDVRN